MGNRPADGSPEETLHEVLTVSRRGQITLPAGMRLHLGIAPGGAVIVEECEGELRLKPAGAGSGSLQRCSNRSMGSRRCAFNRRTPGHPSAPAPALMLFRRDDITIACKADVLPTGEVCRWPWCCPPSSSTAISSRGNRWWRSSVARRWSGPTSWNSISNAAAISGATSSFEGNTAGDGRGQSDRHQCDFGTAPPRTGAAAGALV